MNPEQPKTIKDTLLNFIVPIVSLVITLILVFAVLMPSLQSAPDLKEELQNARNLEGQLRTKLGVLNKLLDFEVIVDENAKLFTKALADEASVPELLTQIDTIAKESGLEVTKLSYSITDVGGAEDDETAITYQAVIVNLGTLGGYNQITTFLQNLSNSARLVDVVSYRFSGENDEDGFNYAATFILRSPYLAVESQAITDAAITVDISDPEFQSVLEKIKALKHYDISVSSEFLNVQESSREEVENIEPEEGEEGEQAEELSEEELQQLIEESEGEQTGTSGTTGSTN